MQVDLLDISSNNGVLDFVAIADSDILVADASGKKHIAIRLSMGVNTFDKEAALYATNAVSAGLGVSYYHLGYPSGRYTPDNNVIDNAIMQAVHFTNLLKALPEPEMLFIDLEDVKIPDLEPDQYLAWLTAWLERVDAITGKEPIIYSPAYWLNSHLPKDHGLGKKYKLWLPNYNHVEEPPLPEGWDNYFLWQFSSNGIIAGDSGHIDVSTLAEGEVIPS